MVGNEIVNIGANGEPDVYDKLKSYCAKLGDQVVRSRAPLQLAGDPALRKQLYGEVEDQLKRVNLEYENKRETLRLGAIRPFLIPSGSWSEFQRRRLSMSGGTVEQYKQPCLLSDLGAIDGFRPQGPRISAHA